MSHASGKYLAVIICYAGGAALKLKKRGMILTSRLQFLQQENVSVWLSR